LILFLCAAMSVFPRGNSDKKNTVRITGTVRLVGAEPFTQLVISNNEGSWYITDADRSKLKDYQYRTVTVEGVSSEIEMKFANGTPAGTRRELKKIKVIEVKEADLN